VTPPAGFKNYVGITSLSAYAVAATDVFAIRQSIEGYNIADLGWGAAGAQTVTLSFWVRSSLTGTFGGNLQNAAQTQAYPFSYTISSANTWEQKSITIAGSTTATWEATNGMGLQVGFSLGSGTTYSGTAGAWVASNIWSVTGATSVVGTNGATFYITGVQLEVGTVATSFDYRPYGTELALCQRYFQQYGGDTAYAPVAPLGMASGATSSQFIFIFPVEMRATPSVSQSTLELVDTATAYAVTAVGLAGSQTSRKGCNITFDVASGLTQFRPYFVRTRNSTSGYFALSAEL
jgi:hypothetical protein